MEESGFGVPQENDKQFTRSLSNDSRWVHFWGAITLNGTLPLIKAGDHCNARDYLNILKQAGVQNLSNLAPKFFRRQLSYLQS